MKHKFFSQQAKATESEMERVLKIDHKEIEIWWCREGDYLEVVRLDNFFIDTHTGHKYSKQEFQDLVSCMGATLVTRRLEPYLGEYNVWS